MPSSAAPLHPDAERFIADTVNQIRASVRAFRSEQLKQIAAGGEKNEEDLEQRLHSLVTLKLALRQARKAIDELGLRLPADV